MMRYVLLYIASVLPSLSFGQYTYFNNGYMPPHPEIGSGYSIELILRDDIRIAAEKLGAKVFIQSADALHIAFY